MSNESLNKQTSELNESTASANRPSAHINDDYDCCARVNAWQQVMQRKASQPLQFRW